MLPSEKYPLLFAALASGAVWVEGRDYVTRDTDGVIVSIGQAGFNLAGTERYLASPQYFEMQAAAKAKDGSR